MIRHSNQSRGSCPDLSRPVLTSVPTSDESARACPNRPNLFRVCAYRDSALSLSLYIQDKRCGRSGRLGQANNDAIFFVPTSARWLGRSGRARSGAALTGHFEPEREPEPIVKRYSPAAPDTDHSAREIAAVTGFELWFSAPRSGSVGRFSRWLA